MHFKLLEQFSLADTILVCFGVLEKAHSDSFSVYHLMPELPFISFNFFAFTISFHPGVLDHLARVKYMFSLLS